MEGKWIGFLKDPRSLGCAFIFLPFIKTPRRILFSSPPRENPMIFFGDYRRSVCRSAR
jgi:hypothetical protein